MEERDGDRSSVMQLNLLNSEEHESGINIPGLTYIPNFITRDEEDALISNIDAQPWLNDLKRRVQHYGYKYDYKARAIGNNAYLGPLPDWLSSISRKLHDDRIFPLVPGQAIVNEYLPGQGISAHIDCVPCFSDTIASLSLGSPCVMGFSNPKTDEKKSIVLEDCSLIVLSGPARYEWQHAIPARKSDIINGIKTERTRRVSLTFRNIILD
jgi:alkylated DNA repair dioxygenase AlkB